MKTLSDQLSPLQIEKVAMICGTLSSVYFSDNLRKINAIPEPFTVADAAKAVLNHHIDLITRMYPPVVHLNQLSANVVHDLNEWDEANPRHRRNNNTLPEVLRCYLEWNGIMGYTDAIMEIVRAEH